MWKLTVAANVSWRVAQYIAIPIHYSRWKFHEHGIHACKWNIFMRITSAKLISEQYFRMKNSNSTHGKNIAHCSGPDMVKSTVVQYVFRTLTLWNSLSCYFHEWLRPDLKIRFSNSSNKHWTGKLTRFSWKSDGIPSRPVKIQRKSR